MELAGRCAGRNQEEASLIGESLAELSDEWRRMETEAGYIETVHSLVTRSIRPTSKGALP